MNQSLRADSWQASVLGKFGPANAEAEAVFDINFIRQA